jgi:hypothetical protein
MLLLLLLLSAETLTRPSHCTPHTPPIGLRLFLRVGSGFEMPLHDHHARYEGQSPEFYSRVFETANVGLQDPRNPGYASAASSNFQNLTDAVAAGNKSNLFLSHDGSWLQWLFGGCKINE